MATISDKESLKIYRNPNHWEVVKLRYFSDYGHGFLGLFNALYKGNIEEVIKDPGPPYIDEKHIPVIIRTLYNLASGIKGQNKPHPKYASKSKEDPFSNISYDSLFE